MYSARRGKCLPFVFAALTSVCLLLLAGCGGGSSNSSSTGSSFVVATDAPMASVASFSVQVQGVELTDSNGNTASLINGTPTVDFARYNGLQTLLDMNDIPAGTYTSVSVVLGPATIGYLNTGTTPPSITTQAATYPSSASTFTYTASLNNPLVVATAGAPAGLRMDFDLQKSIGVDANGNLTGAVTPTFHSEEPWPTPTAALTSTNLSQP